MMRARHPRLRCGEEGCGRQLASDTPPGSPCPWCGGVARRLELGAEDTGTLVERTAIASLRSFYRLHPWWLVAQITVIVLQLAASIVSLLFGGDVGGWLGIGFCLVLALVALFVLPAARERVEVRTER